MAKNEVSEPRIRAYQCMFVLYPESQQAAIEYCQKNLPCAWALHDKDVWSQEDYDKYLKKNGQPPEWKVKDLKKAHVHFVCKFKNQRWFTAIANDITKCSGVQVPVSAINKCNNLYKAYVYLWHKLHLDKYPYDEKIVGMNEFEVPSEHAGVSQEETLQVQALLDMPTFKSVEEMARWAHDNGCWASFRKNYVMWRDIQVESQFKAKGKELKTRLPD